MGLKLWALISLAASAQAQLVRRSHQRPAKFSVKPHGVPTQTTLLEVKSDGIVTDVKEMARALETLKEEARLYRKMKASWTSLEEQVERATSETADGAHRVRHVKPVLAGKQDFGVVIMADLSFQEKYAAQIQSVKCYVRNQGYDLFLLQGEEFPKCDRFQGSADKYFYLKHCAVAELLSQQKPKYSLAVLDADVAAVVMDRPLSHWSEGKGDLQFYERIAGDEVMAGNYIAKNVPWVRQFLREWADMLDVKPPGFSSCDNGAIHLLLVKALELDGASTIEALYNNLTAKVDNLNPYWSFVKQSKQVLGPPRAWDLNRTKLGKQFACTAGDCILTIWPRMNFFVDDGVYLKHHANHAIGPVMHHGIKNGTEVASFYFQDLGNCKINEANIIRDAKQFGKEALVLAEGYTNLYQAGTCKQCTQRCAATFTCPPLDDREKAFVLLETGEHSTGALAKQVNHALSDSSSLAEVGSYDEYGGRLPPQPVIWHRMMAQPKALPTEEIPD